MMLTRTMKEIWLFGGLDTLVEDRAGRQADAESVQARKKVDEDVQAVEEGFKKFLGKYESTLNRTGR